MIEVRVGDVIYLLGINMNVAIPLSWLRTISSVASPLLPLPFCSGQASGKSRALASIGATSSNNARAPKTPSQNGSVKTKTPTPSTTSTTNNSASSGDHRPERTGGGRAYGSSSFRGVNLNGNRWLARISQVGGGGDELLVFAAEFL